VFERGKMSSESRISTALSLLRRLPPNKVEQNLSGLLNLLPDDTDELLQRVDQPLQEATDKDTVRARSFKLTLLVLV